MQRKNNRIFLSFIILIAFIIRVSYAIYIHGDLPVQDAGGYDSLAVNLLERGELSVKPGNPTAKREPAYPIFLSIVYFLFGHSYFVVRVAQSLIGAFTCLIIYFLAKRVMGRRTAIIAVLIASCYPFFIYYTGYLLTETLYTFLLVLAVYFFFLCSQDPSLKNIIFSGIFMGLTALCKSSALALFPFFLAGLIVNWKRTRLKNIFIIVICFTVVLLPWVVRNYRVFHYPLVASTNAGYTIIYGSVFWEGQVDGTNLLPEHQNNPIIKKALELDEIERNAYYCEKTVNFIKANPGYYLKIMVVKFFKLWRLYPHINYAYGEVKYKHSTNKLIIISLLSYGVILPFSLLGIILSFSQYRKMVFFYSIILIISLICMVFFSQIRYRLPVMPYMIIFAAYGISSMQEKLKSIKSS